MTILRREIRPPGPLRFHESVSRFQVAPEERVNRYDGEVLRRVVEDGAGGLVLIEAGCSGDGIRAPIDVRLRAPGRLSRRAAEEAERALRHILALDLDLGPFYRMARGDPALAPLTRRFRGLRPVRYLDLFEALVTAITTQQVNLAFGGRIRARMVERWGERMVLDGEVHYAFPRPERLARARTSSFRGLQFSERKAEYVIGLARIAAEGELEEEALRRLPLAEAVEMLTAIRGIGRWTAEQALFRALGRVEAFPGGDLGVQKMVARYCFGRERVEENLARERGERWAPWGALALTYLGAAWRTGVPPAPTAAGAGQRTGGEGDRERGA